MKNELWGRGGGGINIGEYLSNLKIVKDFTV